MGLLRALAVSCAGAAFLAYSLPTGHPVQIDLEALKPAAPAAVAGMAVGVVASAFVGDPALGGAFAAFAALVPSAVSRARRRRAAAAAAAMWPDFLAVLRGRISAGDSVGDAARFAAVRQGGPVQPLADLLARRTPAPLVQTLTEARAAYGDPIADRVLSTLATASEVGGGRVDAVLASLSRSVADEVRLRSAHEAALTQQRLTAGVALVAPWALLLLTITTNPQAAAAFHSPSGRVVILIGFAGTVAGRFLTARAARLAAPPRVLA